MKIPGYRLHSSGQARVTIHGKDHLLGPYNSRESKAKYRDLIREFLDSKPDVKTTKGDGTIGGCLAAYLDHALVYYAANKEYDQMVTSLKPVNDLAEVRVEDFGPKVYKQIRDLWMARDNVSRQYVNKVMARVRRWVKWCVSEEMMPASSYESIRCVEPLKAGRTKLAESQKIRPVELARVDAAVACLPQVVADMVRLQLLTAARPAEICAITPAMVDRSGEIWEVNFTKHKTAWRGKHRTIYVGKSGQAILGKYLDRGPEAPCFSPGEAMEERLAVRSAARVTPANQGNGRGYTARARKGIEAYQVAEAYTTATYGRAIKYACKKAGVAHWSPNQLRHTRSTEIRKVHGLEASQVILGHSKCDVTQIYAEANRELAIEVAKKSG